VALSVEGVVDWGSAVEFVLVIEHAWLADFAFEFGALEGLVGSRMEVVAGSAISRSSANSIWIVWASSPECSAENRAKDRDVDGKDTDESFADTLGYS
jgi:hypothetical protein